MLFVINIRVSLCKNILFQEVIKHLLSLKCVLKCFCWMGVISMWLYSTESSRERVEVRDRGERDLETNKHSKSKGQDFVCSPGHNSINGSHRARIPPAFTIQGQNLIILPSLFLLQQFSPVLCKPQSISVWHRQLSPRAVESPHCHSSDVTHASNFKDLPAGDGGNAFVNSFYYNRS